MRSGEGRVYTHLPLLQRGREAVSERLQLECSKSKYKEDGNHLKTKRLNIPQTWNLLNAIRRSNSWTKISSSLCDISHIFPSCVFEVVSQPSGLFLNSEVVFELFESSLGESKILNIQSVVKSARYGRWSWYKS